MMIMRNLTDQERLSLISTVNKLNKSDSYISWTMVRPTDYCNAIAKKLSTTTCRIFEDIACYEV